MSIRAFFAAIYGDQAGYLELWTGYTRPDDPSKIDLDQRPGERWVYYEPARAEAIAERCATLARTHGNVYVSSSLYDRPARPCNGGVPVPSRVIFVDDAPEAPELPYSLYVRTSPASGHGYYLLDGPVDATTRRELQTRAAHALGSDTSGADIEQLVRVPGTFNTKYHERYPVHIETSTGRRSCPDELRAAFPTLPPTAGAPGAALDDPMIARWLANIDQLLGPHGLPKRLVNPNGQTRRILAGTFHLPSTSEDRAAVVRGLVMHGYPDAEIAALAIHFCDYGRSASKGSHWLYADIARLIAKERAHQHGTKPEPTLLVNRNAAQPLPDTPPRRKGRPQRVDAAGYLDWLTAHIDAAGTVLMTRKEIAAELAISVPTVDRLEAHLRAAGQLARHTSKDRRSSWVELFGTIKNARPEGTRPQPAAPEPAFEVLSEVASSIDARVCEKKHSAPIGPLVPPDASAGWAQETLGELPKRKRHKRPTIDTLPLAAQVAELADRLKAVRRAKRKAKWIGHDSQVRALERQGELIRIQLEAAQQAQAAATIPPAGEQSGFDLVPGPVDAAAPVPSARSVPPPAPDSPRPSAPRWSMSSMPADDWLDYLAQTGQVELLERLTGQRGYPLGGAVRI